MNIAPSTIGFFRRQHVKDSAPDAFAVDAIICHEFRQRNNLYLRSNPNITVQWSVDKSTSVVRVRDFRNSEILINYLLDQLYAKQHGRTQLQSPK